MAGWMEPLDWTDYAVIGGVLFWLLGLNLWWLLGTSSSHRSERCWRWATPMLWGITGWYLGGLFDSSCNRAWDLVGGGVGVGAGFILGSMLAEGRFD
jgi:hypothetical protein